MYFGTKSTAVVRFALFTLGIAGLLAGCERLERPLHRAEEPADTAYYQHNAAQETDERPEATAPSCWECYTGVQYTDSGLVVPNCETRYLAQAWEIAERLAERAKASGSFMFKDGFLPAYSISRRPCYNVFTRLDTSFGYPWPILFQYASVPHLSRLKISIYVDGKWVIINDEELSWGDAYGSLSDPYFLDLNGDNKTDIFIYGGNLSGSRHIGQNAIFIYNADEGRFQEPTNGLPPNSSVGFYRTKHIHISNPLINIHNSNLVNVGDGGLYYHYFNFFEWVDASTLRPSKDIIVESDANSETWTAYRIHPNGDTTHVGRDSINAWLSELQAYIPLPGAMAR